MEKIKFFGLSFDSELTWEPHIRNLRIYLMKTAVILIVLSHTKWGFVEHAYYNCILL